MPIRDKRLFHYAILGRHETLCGLKSGRRIAPGQRLSADPFRTRAAFLFFAGRCPKLACPVCHYKLLKDIAD